MASKKEIKRIPHILDGKKVPMKKAGEKAGSRLPAKNKAMPKTPRMGG
jgi:hypothetical protein